MCNGECQSWNLPCNGTCLGFVSVEKTWLEDYFIYYTDRFWKCPFEDKCISAFHLCNQAEKDLLDQQENFQCENGIHKSRLVCDNPDEFEVILNCTKQNLTQCPGKKTQQCIFGEEFCNGVIDCMDRYNIYGCRNCIRGFVSQINGFISYCDVTFKLTLLLIRIVIFFFQKCLICIDS
jgi:hypothetical protein